MDRGTSGEKTYSVGDMVSTLNVSRTTLLYYEQLGIVRPGRDEMGYRAYRSADVFRLMSALLLKSAGVEPKDLGERLDDAPFSDEHFAEYLDRAQRDVAYAQARLESLQRLDHLRHAVGTAWEEDVEPYYISFDRAETGYHDFPDDEALVSLLANMPLGGLGSMNAGDYFSPDQKTRWGRTIPVRFAWLVPGLPQDLTVIGGCHCVTAAVFRENITIGVADTSDTQDMARAYMDERGLEPAGSSFCPYSLPSDSGFYVPVCVPVRERSS